MAYSMNPGMMSSNRSEMSYEESKTKLFGLLDEICTYLYRGVHWNAKAANACRKISVRGLGRYHDHDAKYDFCELQCLEKIVGDKLLYMPKVDMQMVSSAEMYDMANLNDFKSHFKTWMDMEDELDECVTHAINKARTIDMQIYEKLCCMSDHIQNNVMRIRMIYDSFDFAGWNTHDISVKSKWIHSYFENEHKDGGEVNINLG